jgi:hypothetical protein
MQYLGGWIAWEIKLFCELACYAYQGVVINEEFRTYSDWNLTVEYKQCNKKL